MWSWIFKVAIVSFLFIFLLHYLYSFFKTTLTSPKIKDLVNKPMRKYDSIYDSLENSQNYIDDLDNVNIGKILNSNQVSTQNPVKQNMKDELKKYLSELSGGGGSGGGASSGDNSVNKMDNNNYNLNSGVNPGVNPMSNSMTAPAIPDFAMTNMSSSSFSSSYAEF